MKVIKELVFLPFRIDLDREQAWQGTRPLLLRPKTFAVLRYLLERRGELVRHEELRQHLWPGIVVRSDLLKGRIHELRTALGDQVGQPRFIETVPRRGYRWIAQLEVGEQMGSAPTLLRVGHVVPQSSSPTDLMERNDALTQLQQIYQQVLAGNRQTVFICGEIGIGKTALVDAFLRQLPHHPVQWISIGQCIEHYGMGESYLPVREALGRLAQRSDGDRLVRVLRRYAPAWLAQLSFTVEPDEREFLQRELQNATPHRLLVQLAEALEAFSTDTPLLLVLEDLHWSDPSTLDVVSLLARRHDPARLLLLLTYRTGSLAKENPSLGQLSGELLVHQRAQKIDLPRLSAPAVREYVDRWSAFAGYSQAVASDVANAVYAWTEGNPLFMVHAMNQVGAQNAPASIANTRNGPQGLMNDAVLVPNSLRDLVGQQVAALHPDEQEVINVASVAGVEFSTAEVAAVLGRSPDDVDIVCRGLTRQQGGWFVASSLVHWPDGTWATGYRFAHSLYQNLTYEALPASTAIRFHDRIGLWEESTFGERSGEIALQLANHFEHSLRYERALHYLLTALTTTFARHTLREAVALADKGLSLLPEIPSTRERDQSELALLIMLAVSLSATRGYTAPEVQRAYERAQSLSRHVGTAAQSVAILRGLITFHSGQGDLQLALELDEQLLQLARKQRERALLLEAYQDIGSTLLHEGKLLAAHRYLRHGIRLSQTEHFQSHVNLTGQDVKVACLCRAAQVLWLLGYPDQALSSAEEAIAVARALAHPHSLAYACSFAAHVRQLRREGRESSAQALAAINLSAEYGFPVWGTLGTIVQGWALADEGQLEKGLDLAQDGVARWQAMGALVANPYLLGLLGDMYISGGYVEKGIEIVDAALADAAKRREGWWDAELYRLKGELLLLQERNSHYKRGQRRKEAEHCFLHAIKVARDQSARALELRATMSLARLWQQSAKNAHVRQRLAAIYGWFAEGFATTDLQEARRLLLELS